MNQQDLEACRAAGCQAALRRARVRINARETAARSTPSLASCRAVLPSCRPAVLPSCNLLLLCFLLPSGPGTDAGVYEALVWGLLVNIVDTPSLLRAYNHERLELERPAGGGAGGGGGGAQGGRHHGGCCG